MEKSELEKRIEGKAKERFAKEYDQFIELLSKNKIAKLLKINGVELFSNYSNRVIPTYESHISEANDKNSKTNLMEIKAKLIEIYTKEETDNLLNKLLSIAYLLEQQ